MENIEKLVVLVVVAIFVWCTFPLWLLIRTFQDMDKKAGFD